jgi:transposase
MIGPTQLKEQKNDFRDTEAIAEAVLRPTQRANNRPSPEAWT